MMAGFAVIISPPSHPIPRPQPLQKPSRNPLSRFCNLPLSLVLGNDDVGRDLPSPRRSHLRLRRIAANLVHPFATFEDRWNPASSVDPSRAADFLLSCRHFRCLRRFRVSHGPPPSFPSSSSLPSRLWSPAATTRQPPGALHGACVLVVVAPRVPDVWESKQDKSHLH